SSGSTTRAIVWRCTRSRVPGVDSMTASFVSSSIETRVPKMPCCVMTSAPGSSLVCISSASALRFLELRQVKKIMTTSRPASRIRVKSMGEREPFGMIGEQRTAYGSRLRGPRESYVIVEQRLLARSEGRGTAQSEVFPGARSRDPTPRGARDHADAHEERLDDGLDRLGLLP